MFNLVSNAAKFTPDGGVIEVTAGTDDKCVIIRVADSGVGLKPEDRERIFGAFEQVETSYSRSRRGTGLGLTLTRNLVQLHGGRIWAESKGLDKGSTFTFTIPYIEADPSQVDADIVYPFSQTSQAQSAESLDDSWVNFQFGLMRDTITGLWNRSAIIDILKRELSRCQRQNTPLGVIALGIDNLEQINDRYGYVTGQTLLAEAARIFLSGIRPYDSAGRYKAEDLIIITPGCGLEETERTAERLRRAIEDHPLDADGCALKVTLSIGVGALDAQKILQADAVIRAVTSALERAKAAGGNRTEQWEFPGESEYD
jgi:diguanylate cyclase (GGDEF)-like protein